MEKGLQCPESAFERVPDVPSIIQKAEIPPHHHFSLKRKKTNTKGFLHTAGEPSPISKLDRC